MVYGMVCSSLHLPRRLLGGALSIAKKIGFHSRAALYRPRTAPSKSKSWTCTTKAVAIVVKTAPTLARRCNGHCTSASRKAASATAKATTVGEVPLLGALRDEYHITKVSMPHLASFCEAILP